jgi:Cu+-exporting ATPase
VAETTHTHTGHDAHAGHTHGACCSHGHHHAEAAPTKVLDPVCGMTVDPATAKNRLIYQGHEYFFCSARCRERFNADPESFLKPKEPAPPAPAGTIYTCPMHPEIRQEGPGSCPICGMALEPEQVSLDDKPDPELIDMTRRFWIALALTLPVFVLEMGAHLGLMQLVSPDHIELDLVGAGDTRGAVGRRAVLRTRMALGGDAQSQHVHADRHGHRCGLGLQRCGDLRARYVSRRVP